MRTSKLIGGIVAVIFITLTLYVAHQIGKYPEEPSWSSPAAMFGNLAFCLSLGLGLPWPKAFAGIVLVGAGWSGYRTGMWMSRRLSIQ